MTGIPAKSMLPAVRRALAQIPIVDLHTHLFDPALGGLLLYRNR